MANKKAVKKVKAKEVKLKKGDVPGEIINRKTYLRENLIEHLEEVVPETERKFSMFKVCELRHTRGSFRDFMDGDFKSEDRKLFNEILQDLKNEGILIHVGGQWWARLQ